MEEMEGMEWVEWRSQQQTKAFLQLLRQSVLETQERWSNREYIGETEYQGIVLNAGALGKVDALNDIIGSIENIQTGEADADSQQV